MLLPQVEAQSRWNASRKGGRPDRWMCRSCRRRFAIATAIFFCGLPCSGKSFWARRLEEALPGRRYSADEQVLRQHDVTLFDERLGALADEARERSWEGALLDLRAGHHVLLDWSLWSRQRRGEWAGRATSAGCDHRILHLDVSLPVLKERLRRRNAAAPADAHYIPVWELERFAEVFEPPDAGEHVSVVRVGPSDSLRTVLDGLGSLS